MVMKMPEEQYAATLAVELLYLRQTAIELDAPMLAYLIDMARMEAEANSTGGAGSSAGTPRALADWFERLRMNSPQPASMASSVLA